MTPQKRSQFDRPLSRRSVLRMGLGAGAGLMLPAIPGCAQSRQQALPLITKRIPSSGEQLPVIGLGSSQTFNLTPRSEGYESAQEVIQVFRELGGKLIDSSPTYQRSEIFIGETVRGLNIQNDLFLATKVNVGPRGKDAAKAQMEGSSATYGKYAIDLMQVWNLGDTTRALTDRYLQEHMEAVQEWKAAGRARYTGVTTSRDPQYGDVERAMQQYTFDFVQLDYSIAAGERTTEHRLLPLALEKGIAVVVNRPFSTQYQTGSHFSRVAGKQLPSWAGEFDCRSWAQFFLKFIVSHPAVTCVIPATGDVEHLRDNMGAGLGRLPDEAMRRRMAAHFESL
jgi:diketogulonate reductase-like aldo/keto reductase